MSNGTHWVMQHSVQAASLDTSPSQATRRLHSIGEFLVRSREHEAELR